jgi:hypothetical protein
MSLQKDYSKPYCLRKACCRHLRNRSRQAVLEILSGVVQEQPLEKLKGCLVVAQTLQRRWISFEINEDYVIGSRYRFT